MTVSPERPEILIACCCARPMRSSAATPWGNLPADWFVGQKAVVIRGTMIAPSEAQYR